MNDIILDMKLPYFTAPHFKSSMLLKLAASKAGFSNIGVITSSINEETIFPKTPPIITSIAKSTTLPYIANSLNSLIIPIILIV